MEGPRDTLPMLFGVVLCGLLTLLVLYYNSYLQRDSKSGARLPKGTFGWPIIGETLALTRDPLGFATSHKKRYGSVFKSSVYFTKAIFGTTPEFAKFVSLNTALFPVQYPKSVEFISPKAVFLSDGPRHIFVKKLFNRVALPESLQTMVQTLESIILENLASWEQEETIVASDETEKLVADTSSYIALGVKNIRSTPEGILALKNLLFVIENIGALPINLPGTTHNKGHKARAALRLYLKSILEQRKSQEDTESDILRVLLQAQKTAKGAEMNYFEDNTIVDEMVGAWFAAFKTTATTLTWILKFLVDYPDVFRRIQAEHQDILKGKDLSVEGPRLTWEDTKKMVYTGKFYQEVQRYLSISFVVPRKAAQDVVYNGFLIPKGWAVLPLINFVHADPAYYEDPMRFNPDRFNAAPKPYTYLPFGTGPHRCPGEEITKLVSLIHIHHLTTTYTYESVGPDRGKEHNGFPLIVGGYPIKVRRQN